MQEPRVGEVSKPIVRGQNDYHPIQMVTIAFMIASGAVLLYILVAYIATREHETIRLSNYFVFSSIILLLSGYGQSVMTYHFERERSRQLLSHFAVFLSLGSVFLLFQYAGWRQQLLTETMPATGTLTFFYILLIAHSGMVLTVLVFVGFNTARCATRLRDPIARLVFYTNNYHRLRITLFRQVWFFLQITWIVIYTTFLLTI